VDIGYSSIGRIYARKTGKVKVATSRIGASICFDDVCFGALFAMAMRSAF